MSAITEARADLRVHMAGRCTAYTGSFEAVYALMFGPLKHDAHVRAFRAFQFYSEQTVRLAAADVAVRAELARQIAAWKDAHA